MEEQNIRMAIDEHWAASAAGDQVAEHEIYHDDAICEYPQSGEVIHGRRNLQALRGHHPRRPSGFEVRRVVGHGNFRVTRCQLGNAFPGQLRSPEVDGMAT